MQRFVQRRNVNLLAVFADSVRRQIRENQNFQQNIKLLGDAGAKIAESDAMKNAKGAVTTTSKVTSAVVGAVGTAVEKTFQSPVVQVTGKAIVESAKVISHVSQKVAEPILDTQAAKAVGKGVKNIKETVVESSSNAFYNEYQPREVRERERQLYYVREGYEMGPNGLPISKKPLGEDLNAGTALAIHESENSKGVWQKFKQESELGQRLFGYSRKIDETDSPLYERLRGFKDMTSINESETAKVIRTFRRLDTKFSQYDFLKFATKYIVPDIIDGFLMKDKDLIDLYCGEKAQAIIKADFESKDKLELISHSQVLDILSVQIHKLEMYDDSYPVVILIAQTHELDCIKNKKGEIVRGSEDEIISANYVLSFTMRKFIDQEYEWESTTNGWILVDFGRGQR